MNIQCKLAAGVVALACSGIAAAQITLYGREDFRGRSITADGEIPTLPGRRFDDRASSVSVRSGTWQLCSEPYYRGTCVTVTPGDYPSLRAAGLDASVASVRELAWNEPRRPQPPVVLYEGPDFTGPTLAIDGTAESLERFNDRARSLIVYDGQWELCQHDRFRGSCAVYGPGRHASLGRLAGDVSSLRPIDAVAVVPPPAEARVVLYEGSNFRGRSMTLDENLVADMREAGFDDRASSLRVEGGRWVFCSNPNFQGQCWTFGPGEYPVLPSALADRVSSGRRVGDDYGRGPAYGGR
jgi:hypothetical protein